VGAEVAAQRRGIRGGVAELFEVDELQQRLAKVYFEAEALVPEDPVVHVQGDCAADEVERAILDAVEPLLVGS
jgi:hypothetical protein